MNDIKYLICGNPCGGTHFMADYLTSVGYPCGHEVFLESPDGCVLHPNGDPAGLVAECSYVAIDYAHKIKKPVIGIFRNPLSVLNSYLAHKFDLMGTFDVPGAMEYIIDRYNRILECSMFNCYIEDERSLRRLCVFLKVPYRPPKESSKNIKHHNLGRFNLGWSDVLEYDQGLEMWLLLGKFHTF